MVVNTERMLPASIIFQKKPDHRDVYLRVVFFYLYQEMTRRMIESLEYWITNALQTIFDQFGWLGVAGMMFFENATGLTPSEIILGMAGWLLISRPDLAFSSIFMGGLFAAVGSVLGASLTYWVARIGGRPIVEKIARWCRIPVRHIYQAEEKFHRWGPSLVLFGRMIPGIRTLISIPAGLARMPFGRFFVSTFVGAYTWCTLLIGVGFWLGEEWEHIGVLMEQYALPLAVIVVLLGALFWWFKNYGMNRLVVLIKRRQWMRDNE